MQYILSENIALRSWWFVPYAFYVRHERTAKGLKQEEYEFLKKCDGLCELPENDLAKSLIARGLIRPVSRGAKALSEWQKPLDCKNRYMPSMNWMLTGKCNYNCMHCFNAADNAPLQSEFTLDEAKICGINGFTITGGEPMAHRQFMDVIREIYKRGMYVFELNTNGFYLTQKILDEMKKIGCFPLIKISFDGLGFHDVMRGRKGAEEITLRAIRLCVKNGYRVKVQMNFNRANKDTILPSLELLDRYGVMETRVIRTTEAPRWEQNAKGQSFSFTEYFDESLRLAAEYAGKEHMMILNFWQFLYVYPCQKRYELYSVKGHNSCFRESLPLCKGNRGMIAVGSDGSVYPCLQMSGWFTEHHRSFGNVKTDGLQAILQGGDYMDEICATVGDLIKTNEECRNCAYLKECCGGCRALAVLTDGSLRGCDRSKCILYREHYPDKVKEAFNHITGWNEQGEIK